MNQVNELKSLIGIVSSSAFKYLTNENSPWLNTLKAHFFFSSKHSIQYLLSPLPYESFPFSTESVQLVDTTSPVNCKAKSHIVYKSCWVHGKIPHRVQVLLSAWQNPTLYTRCLVNCKAKSHTVYKSWLQSRIAHCQVLLTSKQNFTLC